MEGKPNLLQPLSSLPNLENEEVGCNFSISLFQVHFTPQFDDASRTAYHSNCGQDSVPCFDRKVLNSNRIVCTKLELLVENQILKSFEM